MPEFKIEDKVVVTVRGQSHSGIITQYSVGHFKVKYDKSFPFSELSGSGPVDFNVPFGWFDPKHLTLFEIWDSPLMKALREE